MKTNTTAKTTSQSKTKTSKTSALPSHASNTLLDADDVTVAFGNESAIENVSLCIHAGEFIGLIGPNGAGKTTLLRTLLGLQKATHGTIRRDKTIVGYVPQRGNSYQGQIPISTLEVVMLNSHNRSQAMDALQRVDLMEYANKPYLELSGGQQQRVLIAKALAAHPDILILDEPTTGVDERSQHAFHAILQDLKQQGLTIVMVSHDIDAVLKLVTRVVCINRSVVYDGAPEHFEADKYMPRLYKDQHRILHHHHEDRHA